MSMLHVREICALTVVALFLSGCTTMIRVRPAIDPASTGYEYYLPQPIILLQEMDESTSVSVEMVPDYSRAYRIDSRTYFASNALSVDTAHGMLSQVSTNADATRVPVAALDAGAGLLTAYFAARATAEASDPGVAQPESVTPKGVTKKPCPPCSRPNIAAIRVRSGKSCLSLEHLEVGSRECPPTSPAVVAPQPPVTYPGEHAVPALQPHY